LLALAALARVPAGHKKTASNTWGGKWKDGVKTETQGEGKTAAAGRVFRSTAWVAVACFIHWWLLAFTAQNYPFLFWAQGYVSQKTL